MNDFDLMPPRAVIAVIGGVIMMLLMAPKVAIFIAGASLVIWGFYKGDERLKHVT